MITHLRRFLIGAAVMIPAAAIMLILYWLPRAIIDVFGIMLLLFGFWLVGKVFDK